MPNLDAPEGFVFVLDESADEIALRVEDHRDDPLFEGHMVDESRKIRRALRALGLDPGAAEIDRSSGGTMIVQGEVAPYTVWHMTLRWPRRAAWQRARFAA